MSFRGGDRGRGGGRGGFAPRGGKEFPLRIFATRINSVAGSRGGYGGQQQQSYGPPATQLGMEQCLTYWDYVLICAEMGSFLHAVEGEMLCESKNVKIPYFNAPIYLENKVHTLSYQSENTI
jgi:H/ACA ribonucleoprotein complex subunit 1